MLLYIAASCPPAMLSHSFGWALRRDEGFGKNYHFFPKSTALCNWLRERGQARSVQPHACLFGSHKHVLAFRHVIGRCRSAPCDPFGERLPLWLACLARWPGWPLSDGRQHTKRLYILFAVYRPSCLSAVLAESRACPHFWRREATDTERVPCFAAPLCCRHPFS